MIYLKISVNITFLINTCISYIYIPCPVDYRSKYMKGLFSFENSAGSGVGLVIGGGISTAVPRVSSLSSAIWGQ